MINNLAEVTALMGDCTHAELLEAVALAIDAVDALEAENAGLRADLAAARHADLVSSRP